MASRVGKGPGPCMCGDPAWPGWPFFFRAQAQEKEAGSCLSSRRATAKLQQILLLRETLNIFGFRGLEHALRTPRRPRLTPPSPPASSFRSAATARPARTRMTCSGSSTRSTCPASRTRSRGKSTSPTRASGRRAPKSMEVIRKSSFSLTLIGN